MQDKIFSFLILIIFSEQCDHEAAEQTEPRGGRARGCDFPLRHRMDRTQGSLASRPQDPAAHGPVQPALWGNGEGAGAEMGRTGVLPL